MSTDSDPFPPRPTRSLHNRVAIVTGAGSAANGLGNGRAAAILLAAEGCAVVCVDMDLSLAEATAAMCEAEWASPPSSSSQDSSQAKPHALALQGDVTSPSTCEDIVKRTVEVFGRLDILFNNVGIGGPAGTALDLDLASFARGLEVNVTSMALMAKYAIPAMVRNAPSFGIRGSIVNMGSVAGIRGGTPSLLYPTSKGAVVNMTRAMAAHHAADGIRCNCLCPGMIYTPMMYAPGGQAGGMSEEAREGRRKRSLLKIEGNAWDVGNAVVFLAGDMARWMTGVVLPVDAGTTSASATDLPAGSSVGKK
jgi:NAD(P)-dependent dehydrogenase (short-subunit alcohol dehydrogenase family)